MIVNVVDSVFWLASCPSRVPRGLGLCGAFACLGVGREIWCGPGIITEIQTLRCKVQYLSYGNFLKFISPTKVQYQVYTEVSVTSLLIIRLLSGRKRQICFPFRSSTI